MSVEAPQPRRAGGASTVDQMSEGSFPASDPPAVWTWETSMPASDEASQKAPGSRDPSLPEVPEEERE